MSTATKRKRQAAVGIKRVEVMFSACEREQLECLRRVRAGEPYSTDKYISTLNAMRQGTLAATTSRAGRHGSGLRWYFHVSWHTRGDTTSAL